LNSTGVAAPVSSSTFQRLAALVTRTACGNFSCFKLTPLLLAASTMSPLEMEVGYLGRELVD
jgi:hypothetical protein